MNQLVDEDHANDNIRNDTYAHMDPTPNPLYDIAKPTSATNPVYFKNLSLKPLVDEDNYDTLQRDETLTKPALQQQSRTGNEDNYDMLQRDQTLRNPTPQQQSRIGSEDCYDTLQHNPAQAKINKNPTGEYSSLGQPTGSEYSSIQKPAENGYSHLGQPIANPGSEYDHLGVKPTGDQVQQNEAYAHLDFSDSTQDKVHVNRAYDKHSKIFEEQPTYGNLDEVDKTGTQASKGAKDAVPYVNYDPTQQDDDFDAEEMPMALDPAM